MEQECKCGCGEIFKVNEVHPGILYKKGHRPKPQKIPCGCGCGTMIDSVDKNGNPKHFVNWHVNRTRREKVGRELSQYRIEHPEEISQKLSKSWERRPRKRIYKECLELQCSKCLYSWVYSGKSQNGGAACPRCKNIVNKRHAFEIDSSQFKRCKCRCENPIPPALVKRGIEYLQGHGPRGIVSCGCDCGMAIYNPDSSGRYRTFIRGHNSNLRGYEFFSKIAIKMQKAPSRPEQRIIDVIKKYELPFRYTGKGKRKYNCIGRFIPDFISTSAPLIIEEQGDWCHTIEKNMKRDERKRLEYLRLGYHVLYLWQGEIEHISDKEIASKIKHALEEASDISGRLALVFG